MLLSCGQMGTQWFDWGAFSRSPWIFSTCIELSVWTLLKYIYRMPGRVEFDHLNKARYLIWNSEHLSVNLFKVNHPNSFHFLASMMPNGIHSLGIDSIICFIWTWMEILLVNLLYEAMIHHLISEETVLLMFSLADYLVMILLFHSFFS